MSDPFHDGERAVQARAGEVHFAELNARMILPAIMPGALPFIARQPWAVLGGSDGEGRLWCSALMGEPGFAEASAEGAELRLDLQRAPLQAGNPLQGALVPGRDLGVLFLEAETRRRLRVNGQVAAYDGDTLTLSVREAFPNCPKHIVKRAFSLMASAPGTARHGETLNAEAKAQLEAADTVFLATRHPERGVDASHRGGAPGFVEVLDARTLRLPDFAGNSLFQSFGNLAVDPALGLLLPDFHTGALLHLSGRAEVLWDQPDPRGLTGGTGRFLQIQVEHWVRTGQVQPA